MRVAFGRTSRRARLVLRFTSMIVVANFLVFGLMSQHLGGDAINGMVRQGHYFLCAHGDCTEVSRSVWVYSYWHTLTAMAGILLVFLEMGIFLNTGDIEVDLERSTPS